MRGRRPGGEDTRGAILEAARESFAEAGFRGTTVRKVAATAGVDAALVHHYFGTKDDLFLAALQVPVDPRAVLADVFAPGPGGAGARLLDAVLSVWDRPEARRPLLTVLRTGIAEPHSPLLRDGLARIVVQAAQEHLPQPDAHLRAQLIATQVLGVLVSRYLLGLEPMASLPRAEVVAMVAPTLQRYVEGPLRS